MKKFREEDLRAILNEGDCVVHCGCFSTPQALYNRSVYTTEGEGLVRNKRTGETHEVSWFVCCPSCFVERGPDQEPRGLLFFSEGHSVKAYRDKELS